jgi:hypothetical protein
MKFLTEILNEKLVANNDAISFLNENKVETQENIDLFSSPCINVDKKIVSIAASIVTIQTEVVSLSENAYAVGCGTTVGVSTVYPDVVKVYSENMSSPTYNGEDPFDSTNTFLITSNVGIGTWLVYTQNDSTQAGIGSLYGDLSVCYRNLIIPPLCNTGVCVSHASSITSKLAEIVSLRSQLTNLITSSNQVKTERREYEFERYGQNFAIKDLQEENTRIIGSIEVIKNYP